MIDSLGRMQGGANVFRQVSVTRIYLRLRHATS